MLFWLVLKNVPGYLVLFNSVFKTYILKQNIIPCKVNLHKDAYFLLNTPTQCAEEANTG